MIGQAIFPRFFLLGGDHIENIIASVPLLGWKTHLAHLLEKITLCMHKLISNNNYKITKNNTKECKNDNNSKF